MNIAQFKKDEWSGLADLLANLIEKYADVLDIENLPEPAKRVKKEKKENLDSSVEKRKTE